MADDAAREAPELLHDAAVRSIRYVEGLDRRPVSPRPEAIAGLARFQEPLPEAPSDAGAVLRLLDEVGSPATMAMAGPRFFGFVIGGALPVTVASNWLSTAWDQNSGLRQPTPATSTLEDVALRWLLELFGLPRGSGGGFVTGATVANFTALAAARSAVLARAGWDVEANGLFGLWAAAAPSRTHLLDGVAQADSWATDCHKWLNVPYDSGLALVRDPDSLRAAMRITAEYLPTASERIPSDYTPELSRRARGVDVWAALKTLGRRGVGELVERTCAHARRFADGLRAEGFEVLNEVSLNQVLVSFGEPAATERVIQAIQADGTCWCAGTVWQGRTAMRISVSSWATTAHDVEASLAAIVRAARAESGRNS